MLARSIKKNKYKRFKKRKIKRKSKRNKFKVNKTKRKNSKNKTYRKKQTGGNDAFWVGYDAAADDDDVGILTPTQMMGIAGVQAAVEIGGPTAGLGVATAIAAAPAVTRVAHNTLCECRGGHFLKPKILATLRDAGLSPHDFECKGCLPPSGLFSGKIPTPGCPDTNSCCRGRFQRTLITPFTARIPNLTEVDLIPHLEGGGTLRLCRECIQSRDEIREMLETGKYPGILLDSLH